MLAFFGWASQSCAQYEDNPLKGKEWFSLSGGLNTMDHISWQTAGTFSSRGETVLTQARIAYGQELIEAANDTFTMRKNRLLEAGLLWGDGYGGKKWYVSGAVGFGFNVRMFCTKKEYEEVYITKFTLGIPLQIEAGVFVSKNIGINFVAIGNWNFRAPYGGVHLGVFYRLNKSKSQ